VTSGDACPVRVGVAMFERCPDPPSGTIGAGHLVRLGYAGVRTDIRLGRVCRAKSGGSAACHKQGSS
jgi:hypothetical protein